MTWKIYTRRIGTLAEKKIQPASSIRSFEEIPGPKPLPVLGNLWRYMPGIGEYSFEKLHHTYSKMQEQYGSIVREQLFGSRVLVHLFDPQDMMNVYQACGSRPVRISHRALERYRRERPELYSCPGLFPSNGEEWYRFRHLFQNVLLAPLTTDSCSQALEDVTDDLIDIIPTYLDEKCETDLQPLLFNWAVECTGVITLNRRLGCLSKEGNEEAIALIQAANDTHEAVYRTENTPFVKQNYKKLEAAQDILSTAVQKYLDTAISKTQFDHNSDSVLAKMMKSAGGCKKDVFTMLLDMFMAGIDTITFSLSFGLYNLAINRDSQNTLREELRSHLPTAQSRMSNSKARFQYLNAVINETLRINPVSIGTGRILQTDLNIMDYHVPANTMLILHHQAASKLEKYFPNAHKFYPERWLRREFTPIVSSPFGYGARMCIGKRLATRELQLALAKMVLNFDISYHYDPIDSCNKLINVPDKPLTLRLNRLNKNL